MKVALASLALALKVRNRRVGYSWRSNRYRQNIELRYTNVMAEAESDEALMVRFARQHDHAAFDELVHRHLYDLKRYLYFLCRNDATAEDLAQEVWIKIIRARERYQPSAKFKTYLFTVAHHHFVDDYRKGKPVAAAVSLDDEAAQPIVATLQDTEQTPEQHTEQVQLQRQLMAVLAELPEPQREVLLLYGDGHSLVEMAEITARPIETVKSQLRYAKDKLKTRIPNLEWL